MPVLKDTCLETMYRLQGRGADWFRHGRPHSLPGRRQELLREGLQEDVAVLHPLQHHQHVSPCLPASGRSHLQQL